MFEILTTVILAITATASPTLPYDYHSYTAQAKTNSLAYSVLEVEEIPHPPEKSLMSAENVADVAEDEEDIKTTPEGIVGLIKEEFGAEWEVMLRVARCESGLNEKAKNQNSTAKGIFQILDGTFKHFKCEGDVLNAKDNIKCGKKILDGQGLGGGWKESYQCWKNI